MKECDKRKSHISSKLHMLVISSKIGPKILHTFLQFEVHRLNVFFS